MCGHFCIGNDNLLVLVLPQWTLWPRIMMFLTSCVGVYTIGSWEGEGGGGRRRRGKERMTRALCLGYINCFLCSMSHVENVHTKQTKTIVCCSAIEFHSGFRRGSASVCYNNSVWQWSLNSLIGGWSFMNTSTLITLNFTPTCTQFWLPW